MMLSQVDVPRTLIEEELLSILAGSGLNPETLVLEDLRAAMVRYLQETLPAIQEALEQSE